MVCPMPATELTAAGALDPARLMDDLNGGVKAASVGGKVGTVGSGPHSTRHRPAPPSTGPSNSSARTSPETGVYVGAT